MTVYVSLIAGGCLELFWQHCKTLFGWVSLYIESIQFFNVSYFFSLSIGVRSDPAKQREVGISIDFCVHFK